MLHNIEKGSQTSMNIEAKVNLGLPAGMNHRFIPGSGRFFSIFFLLALGIAVLGCSKVTQENYSKLQIGMTLQEVEDILGKPTHCQSRLHLSQCIWESGDKSITMNIVADKVVYFSGNNL